MILSFIEIEDLRNEHLNDGSLKSSVLEMEVRENIADGEYVQSPAVQNPDLARIHSGIKGISGISKENSGENNSDSSDDMFELKFLRYREKFEKERFARELLTGKQ